MKKGLYRKFPHGQVLSEYVLMVVMCLVMVLAMMLFLAAFTRQGARMMEFVAWEPSPPSYNEMLNMTNGTTF